MIVQCEGCLTRFRLADERVKPGGIKVRCSKCKQVFAVYPPEPEPEEATTVETAFSVPETSSETTVQESSSPELSNDSATKTEEAAAPTPDAEQSLEPESQTSFERSGSEFDFSAYEKEFDMDEGIVSASEQSALSEESPLSSQVDHPEAFAPSEDYGASEVESAETPFSSSDTQQEQKDEEATSSEGVTGAEDASETIDFNFVSEESSAEESTFEFDEAPSEDEPQDAPSFLAASGEDAVEGSEETFSFDDENPFADEEETDWSDADLSEENFDFEEPTFEGEHTDSLTGSSEGRQQETKYGEIDFSNDISDQEPRVEVEAPPPPRQAFNPQDDLKAFETASPQPQRRPETEQQPVKIQKKKSSLSRILLLLILLLLAIVAAASYLSLQSGSSSSQLIGEYLPFLKGYLGEMEEAAPADRFTINVNETTYITGQTGQMLVIQGSATNNYRMSRSSISVKAILVDSQGKALRQQTVFCGNPLQNDTLANMPFSRIEEAMNNEFGDSLSNMNVASGASIPFTIVFRNLPDGVANINVEVADSKPGAN